MNVSKCCRPSKFPWGLRFPVRPPPGARPLCYDAEVFGKGIERGRVIGKVIGGAQGEGRRAHRRHSRQIRAPCDGHAAGHVPGRGAAVAFAGGCGADVRQVRAVPRRPAAAGRARRARGGLRGGRGGARRGPRAGRDGARHVGLRHRLRGGERPARGLGRLRRRVRAPRGCALLRRRRGPDGPLRDALPGARGRARLHRPRGGRRLCRRREPGAQGQPVPHGLRVRVRAPLRGPVPPHAHRRSGEHPRHQAVRRGPGARRPGGTAAAQCGHRAEHRRGGGRPERAHLRVLPCAHGAPRDGVRGAQPAGRHAALRHTRLPPSARAPGRGPARHPLCRLHHGALRHAGGRARDGRDRRELLCGVCGRGRAGGQDACVAERGRRGCHVGR